MLVEFSGTPGSGKNAIIKEICKSQEYYSSQVVSGTESPFDYKNSNFELRILWSIFDTYAQMNEVVGKQTTSKLTVLNRGLYDRLAWARLLALENRCFAETADYLEKWLRNQEPLKQTRLIFLFLTSFEKVRMRKKLARIPSERPKWVLNPVTIQNLNEIYLCLYTELKDSCPVVLIDDLNQNLELEQKMKIVDMHIREILAR